jgi:hypothetical protein
MRCAALPHHALALGRGYIVSDPSSYWSEHADASDAALIKGVDLDSITERDCRQAGFYDN